MKKIFTLAAALMASFSLMAADQFIALSDLSAEGDTYSYDGAEIKANKGPVYVELPGAGVSGTVTFFGSSNKDDRFLYINGTNGTVKDESRSMVMNTEGASVDYTADDIASVEGKSYLVFSTTDDYKFKKFSYTVSGLAPVTDPVSSVTLAGPTEAFVGYKVTFSATPDVSANAYKWTVNGSEQEGANKANFDFIPEAAGTFTIVCSAKNDNNSDWVASNAIEVVVTAKSELSRVKVEEATVWDWTKAASVEEIKWDETTTPAKDVDTVLLANVEGMNNNADFNSQALLFAGQYPVRGGKYCQGPLIIFETSVAGYVQVDFSNTGSKDVARYIAVNGVVNTEVGSLNTDMVSSAKIPVEAGEVKIEGSFEAYEIQYLRIYKITFGVGDVPVDPDPVDPDPVDPDPVDPGTGEGVNWRFNGAEAPAVGSSEAENGFTVEFLSSDPEKSFSLESAAYNAAVPEELQSKGAKGLKLGGNALSLKVTYEGGFKAGDVVSICGYNPWKVSSSEEHSGDIAEAVVTGTAKTDYNVGSFTLSTNADALFLMRAEGTGTGIAAIKLVRGGGTLAVDNTETAVKAVKVIRNGVLLIEKNGVLYNAQGAIVK